jgi:hypothetical protein
VLRDILCFEVFNPLTVGRMVRGAEALAKLQESVDRSVASVNVGGADIKRVLLRMGAKRYTGAVERFLLEQITQRIERKMSDGAKRLKDIFAADAKAIYSFEWVDGGGQLMPRERLDRLCKAIASGEIDSIEQLQQSLGDIRAAYDEDAWLWARCQAKDSLGLDLDEITAEQAKECVSQYCEQQQKFLRLVLLDAEREYDEGSRVGFGLDGDANAAAADFLAVRGKFEENSFVKQVSAEIESLPKRCEAICKRLASDD